MKGALFLILVVLLGAFASLSINPTAAAGQDCESVKSIKTDILLNNVQRKIDKLAKNKSAKIPRAQEKLPEIIKQLDPIKYGKEICILSHINEYLQAIDSSDVQASAISETDTSGYSLAFITALADAFDQ